jgi:PAS domain S-box-containing protein
VVARPDALTALLDASALLLAQGHATEVVSGILDLARHVINADAYAVWRTYDAYTWRALAAYGLSASYRREIKAAVPVPPSFQAIQDVTTDPTVQDNAEIYKAEGIRSMMIVPLQLRDPIPGGPNAGTITFYWRSQRSFSELDVAYASALANLSAAALNLSELHEQNQLEKRRLAFLAEASAVLASSLDYEATLQRVAQLAVTQIADWCSVHVIENGVPSRLIVAHADPAKVDFAKEYTARYPEILREDRGIGLVMRTGETEVYPRITDEMITAAISDPEQLEMIRRLQMSSSILVPLKSRGKVLGALRLVAAGGDYNFSQDDVQLAEDIARRAAAAIENAKLHRAVLDQKDRLSLAHSAARMGTWHWDLIHQEMVWSDEFKEIHGIDHNRASTAGGGSGLIHPDDFDRVLREVNAVLNSDAEYVSTEHRAVAGDGRIFWVHSRGRIERSAEGKALSIIGITMDVTERHHAENALRRSEKLATAGRLAATVAHEINNPLESIVNLVYLARQTAGIPQEAAEFLTTTDAELTRIAQIVRQTLGFYREAVDPRNSNISQIVAETCEVYRHRMNGRSVTCDMDLDESLYAHVIPGELKQVIANLVANAVDAIDSGGRIQVSVKRDGDAAVLTIADTGSGIEEEHMPHLFEPFFTTKAEVGTGLGLWVTKGIVEKQRGKISISSSTAPENHGTTIAVKLPLA